MTSTTSRGSAREKNGHFYARARYGRSKRLELRVPWATKPDDAAARAQLIGKVADELVSVGRRDLVRNTARELAEASNEKALAIVQKTIGLIISGARKVRATGETTFAEWARRYTSGELSEDFPDHVRKKDFADDASRLKKYILPHVGDVAIESFRQEHGDLVMRHLPPGLSSATRRHVAQIVSHLMHLAVFPGKIISATPLPRGWLPKIRSRKHYSCLFPKEEAKLLGSHLVAESFRLFCGVLNREGMRLTELLDCEWFQWGEDCRTFLATKTKTDDPRMWAVRPDVARAMRYWRERSDAAKPFAYVAALGDKTKLAERFRAALQGAGVTRAELFSSTSHTGKLRAHDMRATFVTVSLAEGKSETWIRDRTAHRSTSMIDRYRRQARQFAELELGSLVDLVEGLGWGKTGGKGAIEDSPAAKNAVGFAVQAEVAERQTQRTQNPLGGSGGSPDELNPRGKATSRDAAKPSSPGLPPPPSTPLGTSAADRGGSVECSPSAALVDVAVGFALATEIDAVFEEAAAFAEAPTPTASASPLHTDAGAASPVAEPATAKALREPSNGRPSALRSSPGTTGEETNAGPAERDGRERPAFTDGVAHRDVRPPKKAAPRSGTGGAEDRTRHSRRGRS